ncbi:MAG: hypothetical protein KF858_17315 [Candidatus Sumerlaeia bacterium]|nr:hypothetical protein [Candidatus Sumerlaeia bacterium]
MRRVALLGLLLPVLTLAAPAQTNLEPLFRVNADGSLPWFRTDSTTRGMAMAPGGSLLVADREPTTAIYRLDPATGRQIGTMNMTGVSGGTFAINKVVAADDGRIYACSMGMTGTEFKIYSWANESANPVQVFRLQANARWGDGFAVGGVGGATRFIVTGSDNPEILIIEDPDGDGTFASRTLTPSAPGITGIQEAAWDPRSGHFWLRQSTGGSANAFRFHPKTAVGTGVTMGTAAGCGAIALARAAREEFLMAVSPAFFRDGETGFRGLIFAPSRPGTAVFQTSQELQNPGGAAANINGSAESVFDPVGSRVYFLVANNSITGWTLPAGTLAR